MTTTTRLPPSPPSRTASTPATPTSTTPATTTATTATATTPTPTTPTPTGLDAATAAGPTPVATPIAAAVAGGMSAIAARIAASTSTPSAASKPPLLELRPGVPDAISVTTVLKQLASGPQAAAVVDGIAAQMKAQLGLDVDPTLLAAAKVNPEQLTNLLALTPQAMRMGFDALHTAHQARSSTSTSTAAATPAAPSKKQQLPKTLKTQNLDTIAVVRPEGELKPLAPGLWQGDVKNASLDDKAAKRNLVLAEIVDRLATNPTAARGETFTVEHNGSKYTNLKNFMAALVADGHTIEAEITHRVADFCSLKTKAPDGSILDVPAAMLVKTGFTDKDGNEAVVPGVHSEIVFHVRSSSTTKGPKLDGDIKWYQGVPNTGFFACDLMRKSTWTGSVEATKLNQGQALQALGLAAVLGDVILDASAQKNLAMSGYGVTGVCNDSVAVVQHALTGGVTAYPLFMRDALLLPEIDKRLADKNRSDDGTLKALRASIVAVPSDDAASTTAKERARVSIPWAPGQEPFQSTADARAILSLP
jgi:hypothetical protein